MKTAARCFVLTLALALPAARVADAQYFGRNKVQYESFDFKVLTTEHFRVYFYPEERDAAEQAARMAERWYDRLSSILQHQLRGKQALILYANHPDFEQTNVISEQPGEATGGVTESLKRRIVLPLGATLAETDHVIGHELVHAFQYDITGVGGGGSAMVPGVSRLPLWFVEGMAEYLSVGPVDAHTAMWMRDAVGQRNLPSLSGLSSSEFFPYRFGQALWAYLAGTFGDEIVGRTLRTAGRSGDVRAALQQATRRHADTLVAHWHEALRASAEQVRRVTDTIVPHSRHLLGGRGRETELNVAPTLSPDGKQIAYLSEAGLFTIDLYLADAETGRTIRKLFSTRRDPHYESLQFVNSAGAWHPDGRRFAFAGVARGDPVLTVIAVESGDVVHQASFEQLGEIFNPAWSPDGERIVFSAQVGGQTDLFIYHTGSRELLRLTNDAYGDLQPDWSPDGRIAFVTDRFGTALATLEYGPYRLATIDAADGTIRPLPAIGAGKHINPRWGPDGRSLYFLSDRGGVTNLFRLDAGGEVVQITNLYTGISGITQLSPAMSVAQQSGRLVYAVYRGGAYELHTVDQPAALAGAAPPPLPSGTDVLPPFQGAPTSVVVKALHEPRVGLPLDTGWTADDYRPSLSLDFVAQPSLGVAGDRFGTYVGGGVTLYWSDMLGNHNMVTSAQVGTFEGLNLTALVGYENRKHRWNWGGVVQQVPYTYGSINAGTGQFDGQQAYLEQIEIFRQTNRQLAGYVAYPFNRVQRLELQGGVQYISFDHRIVTRAYSLASGRLIGEETNEIPAGDPLTLGMGSVALVFDNSFFGATSPLVGQRYRFEVSPAIGTISFTTALADYRRYVMPLRPFTIAGRLLHIGRYGADADDERMTPLFLGYPSLVRGYEWGSFNPSECPSTPGAGCPVIDRLFGSRLLVGNVELRFPLFGLLGLGEGFYGFLPIEAAVFYDAGVAWTRLEDAELFGGVRETVTSAGVTFRMNMFGYAIAALDWVKPFNRPSQGWMLRVSLTPGF